MDKGPAARLYHRIYNLVKQIPAGQVATYGQIAKMVGQCGPRQVGYAMSQVPADLEIPWHRVINSQGRISVRKQGGEDPRQVMLLKKEGIIFDKSGKIDFTEYAWFGPDWEWMREHHYRHAIPPGVERHSDRDY